MDNKIDVITIKPEIQSLYKSALKKNVQKTHLVFETNEKFYGVPIFKNKKIQNTHFDDIQTKFSFPIKNDTYCVDLSKAILLPDDTNYDVLLQMTTTCELKKMELKSKRSIHTEIEEAINAEINVVNTIVTNTLLLNNVDYLHKYFNFIENIFEEYNKQPYKVAKNAMIKCNKLLIQ